MAEQATAIDVEYQGEVLARSPRIAVALAYLCPGLAYMYVGRLLKGLTANLLVVLMIEIFIVTQSVLKFFPLMPLVVLVLAWVAFATATALDVRRHILEEIDDDRGRGYVLKSYNHWMLYSAVFLLSYLVPIAVSSQLSVHYLWGTIKVSDAAMYPTMLPGDVLLVDKSDLRERQARRGEVVVVVQAKGNRPSAHILRVVGVPDDQVSVMGDSLYINDEHVKQAPFSAEGQPLPTRASSEFIALVESNMDVRYLISMSRKAFAAVSTKPIKLKANRYFLLSDNRSQVPIEGDGNAKIRDSRDFGAIDHEAIRGRPLYIAWSQNPANGEVRWDRIGLRVQH